MKEKTIKALVEDISPLTDSIMRLILTPEKYVAYQAGQYLQILFGEEAFSYSIANAPLGSHKYELHIRHSLENPYNQRLFAHIKQHGSVNIRLPFGECSIEHLHPQRPILFIAGGTGFAPVKAMIEQLLSTSDTRPFELFWGARLQNDLYMDEKVTSWQEHVSHFTYVSSVSEDNAVPLVSLVLAKHPQDLGEWQIVISGPFDMVYSTRDALVNSGISPTRLFSDAFSFEAK
ncbi:NAD(P)H-flavin reductase [Legionella qingyii]|uniref:NAD(P)H-flavin reductase n=1 Tax=Legionella qingyii TaxID=2184757 RepID=A0A317U195_9GAMM|nr:NAD(P)H-flavin reductase [Legionella qingyii]PWY55784.1 NAD(P)H-flavin reductase [Legionella qingyii]PWY56121.1 NAD(P)H-flavin reductase [Legionella qingyii]RUR23120.1 NAD(P)H-flavin reductase [Legionella qingyii]RUR26965.1 NAD(P)H-flavin reductase [Legionella qingyii]